VVEAFFCTLAEVIVPDFRSEALRPEDLASNAGSRQPYKHQTQNPDPARPYSVFMVCCNRFGRLLPNSARNFRAMTKVQSSMVR